MLLLSLAALSIAARSDPGEWSSYGHDPGGQRYAVESQIDKTNVGNLNLAWEFHTRDEGSADQRAAFECTPIYVDGALYVVSAFDKVFRLDPDTGNEAWSFDPKIPRSYPFADEPFTCRGVSTWKNPRTGARTIFLATQDSRLIALDSESGTVLTAFGEGGTIELRTGVANHYPVAYNETSAPCVIGSTVVVGSSIGDGKAVDLPSGVVRAFDAETGKLKWSWEPLAGLPDVTKAMDPDGSAYLQWRGGKMRTGAGNAWSTISADPEHGLIFLPTGSASPDFFGGLRPGDNADADSVVALNAETGKRVWAFQVVHHNVWDYDVPAQPILCTVAGKEAVVVMTKMGHVFVLDRLTGKPLLPVEERAVPTNGVPGEQLSKTQPFPVWPKPLEPYVAEPWGLTEAAKQRFVSRISRYRNEGPFTPPSLQGTVLSPGNIGGCNWSGGSFDPSTNTLFVNTNNLPTLVFLVPRGALRAAQIEMPDVDFAPQYGTPYAMHRGPLFEAWKLDRAPATAAEQVKPPWGTLHAIDLSNGHVRWEVPLGFEPEYASNPEAKKWGAFSLGGSFVTSTGLVFIAGTRDGHLRAFDYSNGNVLWDTELPAGGQAAPMTFYSSKTGRQYVVQCAGGHKDFGTKRGDSVVAFAIPR